MAKSLSVATGLVEYDINGAVTVRFNPTDSEFVARLYDSFTSLDARQDEFQSEVDAIGDDGPAMFEYARKRDAEMRGIIDGLLGEGVADALFPDMNCYALADGLPAWMNLMFALADEVQAAYSAEHKRSDPRLQGYNQKYNAMLAKYKQGKR